MLSLGLSQVTKSFGSVQVIQPTHLEIEPGEFVVFVGPSGCGKSTLLRLIAGLEAVTSGEILIGGREVTHLPPIERKVAMVFQSYALYPHMTVGENIAFGLKIAGMAKAERLTKAREAARLLQLEPLFDRKPKALSGGQRQRVAIGRAIVKKPGIFLFDEPLSNLDAELRVQMRLELAKLHEEVEATMIYVTHDQVEAMTLADKIVVLRDGTIEQVGAPLDLYHNPANEFVAGFIGSPKMNFFDGKLKALSNGSAIIELPDLGDVELTLADRSNEASVGTNVRVGVRPEQISICEDGEFQCVADFAERLGNVNYVHARTNGGRFCIESKDASIAAGQSLRVSLNAQSALAFSSDGQRL